MADRSWTLTVSYVNGVATITDPEGGSGDETIFRNESDEITFQPGTGVRAVTALVINRPVPLPEGVTVAQILDGPDCVVTDSDSLAATAQEVDVAYCIHFTDSNGVARSTDPQLINRPTLRPPSEMTPMARPARSQPGNTRVKPSAPAAPPATAKPGKPGAGAPPAGGKPTPGKTR